MGWLLHLVQRWGDWMGCSIAQSTPHCTKCNSPPVNGQCTTNFIFRCGTITACILSRVYIFLAWHSSCEVSAHKKSAPWGLSSVLSLLLGGSIVATFGSVTATGWFYRRVADWGNIAFITASTSSLKFIHAWHLYGSLLLFWPDSSTSLLDVSIKHAQTSIL